MPTRRGRSNRRARFAAARHPALGLLVAVFPANVYMVGLADALHIPAWVLWARLPLQPLLIWAVWRAAR